MTQLAITEPTPADHLAELEQTLARSLNSLRAEYQIVRGILREIRDDRLYTAAGFETFDDYTAERWELSRRHVDRLINWDLVAENVQAAGLTPPDKEAHARELADLDPEVQAEIWQEAQQTANGDVTAKHVRATRERMLGKPSPLGQAEKRERSREAGHSSESNEWYSPRELVDAARDLFGGNIDLDPASATIANEWIQAGTIYTADDDGLAHSWFGRVWLNPPNGLDDDNKSQQAVWSSRLLKEAELDVVEACLFVNSATGARWFKPLWSWPICFIEGRPQHIRPDGNAGEAPTHFRVIVYVGPREKWPEFEARFGAFGYVHMPRTT